MIGGEGYSLDFEQQIPFSGLIHTENINNAFGGLQIKIQHTFQKKQQVITPFQKITYQTSFMENQYTE